LVFRKEFLKHLEHDVWGMATTKRCFESIQKVWYRNLDAPIPLFLKSISKSEREGTNR